MPSSVRIGRAIPWENVLYAPESPAAPRLYCLPQAGADGVQGEPHTGSRIKLIIAELVVG